MAKDAKASASSACAVALGAHDVHWALESLEKVARHEHVQFSSEKRFNTMCPRSAMLRPRLLVYRFNQRGLIPLNFRCGHMSCIARHSLGAIRFVVVDDPCCSLAPRCFCRIWFCLPFYLNCGNVLRSGNCTKTKIQTRFSESTLQPCQSSSDLGVLVSVSCTPAGHWFNLKENVCR